MPLNDAGKITGFSHEPFVYSTEGPAACNARKVFTERRTLTPRLFSGADEPKAAAARSAAVVPKAAAARSAIS